MIGLVRRNLAELTVLAVSSIVAGAIFLATDPISLGDSTSFLISAYDIRVLQALSDNGRTLGYPLLIAATLYPWTLSFIPLLAVQAVFAALIPWYIFKILRYISLHLACFGSLISIATLLPYEYQNVIFPDQTQLFLMILICYLATKYYFDSRTMNMVAMFLALACISFLRPSFGCMILLLMAVVGTVAWRNRRTVNPTYYLKPLVVLTVAVAGLHVAYAALDAHASAKRHMVRGSITGRVIFLNAWINSVGVAGAFEDGNDTQILRERILTFFRDAPAEMRDINKLRSQLFDALGKYQSDPRAMVETIFHQRDPETWLLLHAVGPHLGQDGDALFMRAALEQYRLHPRIIWNMIVRGLASYLLGYPYCEGPYEQRCMFYPATEPYLGPEELGWPHNGPWLGMKPYTAAVLGEAVVTTLKHPFSDYAVTVWPAVYRVLLPACSIVTGLGLVFVFVQAILRRDLQFMRTELAVFSIVLSVYLLYFGPMMIVIMPLYRYVSAGALFLVMSALISLRIFFNKMSYSHW